jgi:hypothetical protein
MAFCSTNTDIITLTNYKTNYAGTSCLPGGGTGFPTGSIGTSGKINTAAMTEHITKLLDDQHAIAPREIKQLQEMNPAEDYSVRSAALRDSINKEYCYYYVRYTFALKEVLTLAATRPPSELGESYITLKNNTIGLNSKLNQILQVIQAIVNSRITSLRDYYGTNTGVNQVNSDLDATRIDLLNHSKLLKNTAMEKDLKSAMVDYTVEKNSSSRNLLAIYGFMNIVAAGLIFYLYRSSKSQ